MKSFIIKVKIIAIWVFSLGISLNLCAQEEYDYLFEDGTVYSKNRFGSSLGSPMLFDPWVVGTVYSNTGKVYYPLLVNYNVMEKRWEARGGNKIITLDPAYFWCVMIYKDDNLFGDLPIQDTMVYIRGLLPKNENEYTQILHNGQNFKLIKQFEVSKSKQSSSVENSFSIDRYLHRSNYYLVFDEKHKKVRLTKKDILKAFGKKKKDIEKYMNANVMEPQDELAWISTLEKIEKEFFFTY